MPCLNEARTLGTCIAKAKRFLARQDFAGEIVVADNGSTDGSQEIAQSLGARVVPVSERGYGNALKAGIKEARGMGLKPRLTPSEASCANAENGGSR